MPKKDVRRKLRQATILYWTLLIYIVAALVWWFITLEKQNDMMKDLRVSQLRTIADSTTVPALYASELQKIKRDHSKNDAKYLGEGSIFLLLICVGAGLVYRYVRRQFYMQQQQQNFMMAVTHELKTPISVVRLNLETIQKYSLDAEKQKKLIGVMLKETSRLNFLTNNILVASQLEGGGYKFAKEEMDLSDMLKDCIQDFRARFPERVFKSEIQQGTDVKGDPLLLQILINNLLENAVKYSPRETPVTAVLEKENGLLLLSIADEGPGINDDEKKKVFSKFYRIGNEATRKTQGTGLGLYLCNKIARDHNADILVTNNIPRGSIFTVTFKL
ncbi:MAG: HAMP domain-containing histidine kinase [Bacteroidetes bacterium]|nr:MAG: HAMP domain-containing histidine kinase [Bacteroidota bacterium]